MAFLREISVERLFGLYDHAVELRSNPPVTFVAGPNGIGKTTLLRLTHALLSLNYQELPKHQFRKLSVSSDVGTLTAIPQSHPEDSEEAGTVVLRFKERGRRAKETTVDLSARRSIRVPSWLNQVGPELFRDQRTGRLVHLDEVSRLYLPSHRRARASDPPEWFSPDDWATDFIETKRLDSLVVALQDAATETDPDKAPIHYYLDAVNAAMRESRGESTRISQLGERSFVRRMLDRTGQPRSVNEAKLRERYSEIEEKAAELAENGLLVESLDLLPAGKLSPTEKRVVRLFLDDFEAKMRPLEPTSSRVSQLREVVQSKFLNKKFILDPQHGPTFLTEPDGVALDANALSSGEQHELALVSRLLFSLAPGTTVLIDEPELSLHVSWQHRMLSDLTGISELAGLSFILATHSTAIINGRWDLVEELGPIDDYNSR